MSSLFTTIRRVLRLDAQRPEEAAPSENIQAAARAADETMPPTPEASIISAPALTEAPLATAPPQESAGAPIEEVDIAPVAATPAMVAESAESGARVAGEPVAVDAAITGIEPTAVDDPDVETGRVDESAYAAHDAPAQLSEESVFMSQSAAPSTVDAFSSADAMSEPIASAADAEQIGEPAGEEPSGEVGAVSVAAMEPMAESEAEPATTDNSALGDAEMLAHDDADAPGTSAEAPGMPITGGMASYAPFPSSPKLASPASPDEDKDEDEEV